MLFFLKELKMDYESSIKPEERLKNFKDLIERDLIDIGNEYSRTDSKTQKPDYAFLYWILLKIFNIDEDMILDHITEYNDKGVDCFVNFEDSKELFIIQCKHYDENTAVIRASVSDFLSSPLALLDKGTYKRSKELQKIYTKAINDPEYRIYMQFYTTNQKYSSDISTLISAFNEKKAKADINIHADFFDLKDIYEKYYGKSYKQTKNLTFNLKTLNKGTFASLKEEYGVNYNYPGYYIITPVSQIYELIKEAKKAGYPLFEANIREYLGGNGAINKAIGDTLKSEEDRSNFLYYNNGLTMIAKSASDRQVSGAREIILENPQIVNGCQTVNTIFSVLDNYSEKERIDNFKDVLVMTKLLIIKNNEEKDIKFYHDVVKYTNKQNPIPDKIFTASNESMFTRLQSEVKRYGLWIKIKQSDKIKFDTDFSAQEKADMLSHAKEIASLFDLDVSTKDLCVDLEKILQISLAYLTDGHTAFTQKSSVLKPSSKIFKDYSIKIPDFLSYENIVRLYFLFKKAEFDRKQSEDLRTPIPYYVLGFLSYHIFSRNDSSNYNKLLDKIFSSKEQIQKIYKYLVNLSKGYRREMAREKTKDYNVLIKTKINEEALQQVIQNAKDFMEEEYQLLTKPL